MCSMVNTPYVSAIESVTIVFYWFQAMICVEYGEHTLCVSYRVSYYCVLLVSGHDLCGVW